MNVITVKTGQSVFDIALQEYGDIQGVLWISEDNTLDGLELTTGQQLIIRDGVINKDVVNLYKNKGISPANDN